MIERIKIPKREQTIFDDYYLMFDDMFPSYQLGLDEEICSECLRKGKDVYELGYLKLDDKNY